MRRVSLRGFQAAAAAMALLVLTGCPSGSDNSTAAVMTPAAPPPVNNIQPVVVDYGPTVNGQPAGYNNALYTTVEICVPGTSTCQSIDHVLVDTGSSGLRIVS